MPLSLTHRRPKKRDTRYEWRVVPLLSLAFGMVGLDRWILGPLFPSIMADLKLDYSQLGTLVGGLGLAWGVFAIVIGNLSDRVGRRAILIPSLVLKSRNVLLGAGCLLCTMSCIFVLGAMVPNYLIDHLKLSPVVMGLVRSGMGWGGFFGEFMVAGPSRNRPEDYCEAFGGCIVRIKSRRCALLSATYSNTQVPLRPVRTGSVWR